MFHRTAPARHLAKGVKPRFQEVLPGLRAGTGLTVLTWLMRVGFFGSPLIVGAVADAVGLRAGLLTVPLAGLAVAALAGALRPIRTAGS